LENSTDENRIVSEHPTSSVVPPEEINLLVHDPVRLGILILLMTNSQGLSFTHLQSSLGLTSGNLSTHAQKLSKAEYVDIIKTFIEFKPRTFLRITPKGLKALKNYSGILEKILISMHELGS
jgi:DNA-binding MarR family transcriptional regulator